MLLFAWVLLVTVISTEYGDHMSHCLHVQNCSTLFCGIVITCFCVHVGVFFDISTIFVDAWKLSILFQLLLCLSYLLASLERSAWNNEYTLHVFRSLLPFIASPKAKVGQCSWCTVLFILLSTWCCANTGISCHHVSVCLSVLSVACQYCGKMAKHLIKKTTPHDSQETLVF